MEVRILSGDDGVVEQHRRVIGLAERILPEQERLPALAHLFDAAEGEIGAEHLDPFGLFFRKRRRRGAGVADIDDDRAEIVGIAGDIGARGRADRSFSASTPSLTGATFLPFKPSRIALRIVSWVGMAKAPVMMPALQGLPTQSGLALTASISAGTATSRQAWSRSSP
jgi:hypothetical protein